MEEARKAYERDYVLKTLDELGGNMSRTAEALGLERSHLYRKMKALGIAGSVLSEVTRPRNRWLARERGLPSTALFSIAGPR